MIHKWIFSSLWILFMILGVTFIKRENIREVFVEIFGESSKAVIEEAVLFDNPLSLIIGSFVPIFNVYYLIMYLIYGLCDKNSKLIQSIKKTHQKNIDDRNGIGI